MFKLLGGLGAYLKAGEVRVDNALFRVHNVGTCVALLAASSLLTASQYVGQPIQCVVHGLPAHVVNTFCWITSTFTMPDAFNREVGKEVAHPGVANEYDSTAEKKYYTYYQWVCFVLFFQAMLCYTPKVLWESCEGGLLRTLSAGLQGAGAALAPPALRAQRRRALLSYLLTYRRRHKMYAARYLCCEALCLANILLQLWMMDSFFNGEFLSYGINVLGYSDVPQEDRVDPMIFVFPRVTKCTFHKYGPSGSLQTHDALCVLPLNILNEKTFVFVWFWFLLLAALLALLLLYRAVIVCVPRVRGRLLGARARGGGGGGAAARRAAHACSARLDLGDWWLLYMLARNLDPPTFQRLLHDLAAALHDEKPPLPLPPHAPPSPPPPHAPPLPPLPPHPA